MNLRCFNPQFFIASRVGDVALEREGGRRGGHRDPQLGVVIDAVRVLCAALPTDDLLPGDRLALDRLAELAQRAGADRIGAGDAWITTAEVDDLVRRLQRLRQEDPAAADEIVRRLVEDPGALAAPAVTA
jgi:hypothetical protein